MKKNEYFNLIVGDRKLLKKIKIKGIIQRGFLISMMIYHSDQIKLTKAKTIKNKFKIFLRV